MFRIPAFMMVLALCSLPLLAQEPEQPKPAEPAEKEEPAQPEPRRGEPGERPRRQPGERRGINREAMESMLELGRLMREHDKDADGMLSAEELGNEELHKKLDANEDGKLDRREIAAGRDEVVKALLARSRAAYAEDFKILDRDEDGKLTKEELGEKYAELLKLAEKEEDGTLDSKEFVEARMKHAQAAARAQMPGRRGQMPSAEDLIKQLDKNEDGKLSKEEVADNPMLTRIFAQADTDEDGFLTKDEIEKFMESRRQGRRAPGGERPRRPGGGERDNEF